MSLFTLRHKFPGFEQAALSVPNNQTPLNGEHCSTTESPARSQKILVPEPSFRSLTVHEQ